MLLKQNYCTHWKVKDFVEAPLKSTTNQNYSLSTIFDYIAAYTLIKILYSTIAVLIFF